MSTNSPTKLQINTPIASLTGVGPAYAKRLAKLGIGTVRDLLTHLPRRYDDFSKLATIRQTRIGEVVSIRGTVLEIQVKTTSRRRMTVTEAIVADETGAVRVAWFNQPYLAKTLKEGDEIILSGRLEFRIGSLQMTSPEYELVKAEQSHTAGIIPVYPETEGVSSKWLRSRIKPLLPLAVELIDALPVEIRRGRQLMDLDQAIRTVHFPPDQPSLAAARRRLAFEELFLLQLLSLRIKLENQKLPAPAIPFDQTLAKEFVGALPFQLTGDQKRAAWEILQDLGKEIPMNRLLEGDVGSGKTVVAAMAAHHAAAAGYQVALMAPTELVARQHATRLHELLTPLGLRVGLLTGSTRMIGGEKVSRDHLVEALTAGEIDLAVGTHALIQGGVAFHRLGLAIIDEQHRFGVDQRARLRAENGELMPHLLSMTATPIPRTLTLTVYGDLDLSVIKELPPGRTPVQTRRVMPHDRTAAYESIRSEVKQGRQVFVVTPLIEESELSDSKAATVEQKRLQKEVFPELTVGLLHGRMTGKEKDEAMEEFRAGKTQILVATSVVEVGVDVPGATVMVIEGAERFGLAQLHQIRGRVGRGSAQAHCLLFSDSESEEAAARLQAVVETQNGFELAERDLELRGSGEVYGVRQSGIPDLEVASLLDHELIKETRTEAENLLNSDPELKSHPLLKDRLEDLLTSKHLE